MKEIFTSILFNIKRSRKNWLGLVVSLVMVPLIVLGYLNFFQDASIGMVAVSGADADTLAYFRENGILYREIPVKPNETYRVSGDFLGYVEYHQDGSDPVYETYVGSEELMGKIAAQTYSQLFRKQDVLVDLLPSVIVVIFLEAVLNMKSFIEDRQNRLIRRLNIVGANNSLYILSILLCNVLLMLVPLLLALFAGQFVYGVDYGYSAAQICAISAVMAFLSCLFAFALCSVVRRNDSAILAGNIIAIVSSLLSGVFGFWKGIDFISKAMPQRMLLEWIKLWKQQGFAHNTYIWLILLLIAILFLFTLFMNKTQHSTN
jgi:hypothetical protein